MFRSVIGSHRSCNTGERNLAPRVRPGHERSRQLPAVLLRNLGLKQMYFFAKLQAGI